MLTMIAEITGAAFALVAAVLWLASATVQMPRIFSIEVIASSVSSSDPIAGEELIATGFGGSAQLEALGKALLLQSQLSGADALFAALSAVAQAAAIWFQHIN